MQDDSSYSDPSFEALRRQFASATIADPSASSPPPPGQPSDSSATDPSLPHYGAVPSDSSPYPPPGAMHFAATAGIAPPQQPPPPQQQQPPLPPHQHPQHGQPYPYNEAYAQAYHHAAALAAANGNGLYPYSGAAFVPAGGAPNDGSPSTSAPHQLGPAPQGPSSAGYSSPSSPYMGNGASPNPAGAAALMSAPTSSANGAPQGHYSQPGGPPPQSNASSPGPYAQPGPYGQFVPNYAQPEGAKGGGANGGYPLPPNMMPAGLGLNMPGTPPMFSYPMQHNGSGMGARPNGAPHGRTVYVGNLPADAAVDELLSQVRFGPIESVKILPEKSCAFISFLDPNVASAFNSDASMRKIRLHEQELKIGFGKATPVQPHVLAAVSQHNATRNVYLGNLDESITEETLRDDLSRFGPIDQVKIVRDKQIGFVHFLSIAIAIKCVQTLSTDPEWRGRRVNYGKDRCAYVPKNQHQQQQHNLAAAAMGSMAASASFTAAFGGMGIPATAEAINQIGNRTVYLGNIHPETTTEEICNSIRGGILQTIRYLPEKHICFVTFVDAQCALAFFQGATTTGVTLHNRRLKIGWGKHSGPPQPGIAMAVQNGASRNVYIGNIGDFEHFNEEKLREDFGDFGDIELVNALKEKQCAFVNFTNITNAIKAIEGIKSHPDYSSLKIAYGKDRCGNPPRAMHYQHHGSNGRHKSPPRTNGSHASPSQSQVDGSPRSPADTEEPRAEGSPEPQAVASEETA